jgi:hypothetical protein
VSGLDNFQGETLHVADPKRDEQLRIVAKVTAILPERDAWLPVLQALIHPGRPALPPHGAAHSPAYQAARTAYLDEVRAWVLSQGRVLGSRHVPEEDQRAFVAATGKHFQPPKEEA